MRSHGSVHGRSGTSWRLDEHDNNVNFWLLGPLNIPNGMIRIASFDNPVESIQAIEILALTVAAPHIMIPLMTILCAPGTVAEFKEHLKKGSVEQCLNVMDVKEQDVIFIPPGTIHSAYGGLVVLEVQQNSDCTYRLTDWGRSDAKGKPRHLDVEKAMNVTDFYSMGVSKYKAARILGFPYRRKLLIKCEKFVMETIELGRQTVTERPHPQRFVVHTAVAGPCRITNTGQHVCDRIADGHLLTPLHPTVVRRPHSRGSGHSGRFRWTAPAAGCTSWP